MHRDSGARLRKGKKKVKKREEQNRAGREQR